MSPCDIKLHNAGEVTDSMLGKKFKLKSCFQIVFHYSGSYSRSSIAHKETDREVVPLIFFFFFPNAGWCENKVYSVDTEIWGLRFADSRLVSACFLWLQEAFSLSSSMSHRNLSQQSQEEIGGTQQCSAVMFSRPRRLSAVFLEDNLPSDGLAGEWPHHKSKNTQARYPAHGHTCSVLALDLSVCVSGIGCCS